MLTITWEIKYTFTWENVLNAEDLIYQLYLIASEKKGITSKVVC